MFLSGKVLSATVNGDGPHASQVSSGVAPTPLTELELCMLSKSGWLYAHVPHEAPHWVYQWTIDEWRLMLVSMVRRDAIDGSSGAFVRYVPHCREVHDTMAACARFTGVTSPVPNMEIKSAPTNTSSNRLKDLGMRLPRPTRSPTGHDWRQIA